MARSKYTEEQKAAIVARASEIGISAAAKEAEVDRSTVSRWCKAAAQEQTEVKAPAKAEKLTTEKVEKQVEEFVEKVKETPAGDIAEKIKETPVEDIAEKVKEDIVEKVKETPAEEIVEVVKEAAAEDDTAKTGDTCDAGKKTAGPAAAKTVIQEKVGDAVAVAQIEIKKAAGKAKRAVRDTTEKVRKTVKETAEKSMKKVRTAKVEMVFETNDGRKIRPEEIAEKIPKGANAAYIKLEENKIYWVKGVETGSEDIW